MARPKKQRWQPLPRRPRGSGSIQRLADGRLRARLPSRISAQRTAREFPPDALDVATAWLDAHLRPGDGQLVHAAQVTVADWSGHWWETYVDGVHPSTTAERYRYALEKLAPVYPIPLADLRPAQLQAIVKTLARTSSASTLAVMLAVWRRCFESAIDNELLTRNPTRGLVYDRGARVKPPRRSLSRAEMVALRNAVRGHRFEVAYVLVLEVGLRIGEILGLWWKFVDLDGARLWIETQFTNGRWRPLPKGKNPHWVAIPPDVVGVLRRERERHPSTALVLESPAAGTGSDGLPRPWSRTTIAKELQAIVAALKLDPLTPHAGRHGLASLWIEHGVSPAEVAQRLGHAQTSTTVNTYVHATREGAARASQIVEGVFPAPVSDDQGGYQGGSSDAAIE
jgi:integrase